MSSDSDYGVRPATQAGEIIRATPLSNGMGKRNGQQSRRRSDRRTRGAAERRSDDLQEQSGARTGDAGAVQDAGDDDKDYTMNFLA